MRDILIVFILFWLCSFLHKGISLKKRDESSLNAIEKVKPKIEYLGLVEAIVLTLIFICLTYYKDGSIAVIFLILWLILALVNLVIFLLKKLRNSYESTH